MWKEIRTYENSLTHGHKNWTIKIQGAYGNHETRVFHNDEIIEDNLHFHWSICEDNTFTPSNIVSNSFDVQVYNTLGSLLDWEKALVKVEVTVQNTTGTVDKTFTVFCGYVTNITKSPNSKFLTITAHDAIYLLRSVDVTEDVKMDLNPPTTVKQFRETFMDVAHVFLPNSYIDNPIFDFHWGYSGTPDPRGEYSLRNDDEVVGVTNSDRKLTYVDVISDLCEFQGTTAFMDGDTLRFWTPSIDFLEIFDVFSNVSINDPFVKGDYTCVIDKVRLLADSNTVLGESTDVGENVLNIVGNIFASGLQDETRYETIANNILLGLRASDSLLNPTSVASYVPFNVNVYHFPPYLQPRDVISMELSDSYTIFTIDLYGTQSFRATLNALGDQYRQDSVTETEYHSADIESQNNAIFEVEGRIDALDDRVSELERLKPTDTGWTKATLRSGFSDGSYGRNGCYYRKIDNHVYLDFSFTQDGTFSAADYFYTLPSGYRPSGNQYAYFMTSESTNIARVRIGSAGRCYLDWVRDLTDGTLNKTTANITYQGRIDYFVD